MRLGAIASSVAATRPETTPDPQEGIARLLRDLRTETAGLSSREATRRFAQYGRNEITRREGTSQVAKLVLQFIHPLALLLWVAAALAVVGGNITLAVAIGAVIVINAVLAFSQEVQASRATEALREFLPRIHACGAMARSPTWRRPSSCGAMSSSSTKATASRAMRVSFPEASKWICRR